MRIPKHELAQRAHALMCEKLALDVRPDEEYGEILLKILAPVYEAGVGPVTVEWGWDKTPLTVNFEECRDLETLLKTFRALDIGVIQYQKQLLFWVLAFLGYTEHKDLIDRSLALPYLGADRDNLSPEVQAYIDDVPRTYTSSMRRRLGLQSVTFSGWEVGYPDYQSITLNHGVVERGVKGIAAGEYCFVTYHKDADFSWIGATKD